MSTGFAIRTMIEAIVIALWIYGLFHEDKVIDFEMNLRRIIVGNIKHAIRTHRQKKLIKQGKHLRLQAHNNRMKEEYKLEDFVA